MTTRIVKFLAFSVLVLGNSTKRAQARAHDLVADLEAHHPVILGDVYLDRVDEDWGPGVQTYRVGVKYTARTDHALPEDHIVRAFMESRLAKNVTIKDATND